MRIKVTRLKKVCHGPQIRELLEAFTAVESARRLSVLEASAALFRGRPDLFAAAGVQSASELAELVVRDRSQ